MLIQLLECAIPLSVLVCVSQKIRVTSPLSVFLKQDQLDFSKASDNIFDHLTSIFPETFGFPGKIHMCGPHSLSGQSRSAGRPARSRGPESPLDFLHNHTSHRRQLTNRNISSGTQRLISRAQVLVAAAQEQPSGAHPEYTLQLPYKRSHQGGPEYTLQLQNMLCQVRCIISCYSYSYGMV